MDIEFLPDTRYRYSGYHMDIWHIISVCIWLFARSDFLCTMLLQQ